MPRIFPQRLAPFLVVALAAAGAVAPRAGAAPPRVHALVGARVVIAPGRVLPSATIVLRDGLIESVGANVTPPPDARVWDLAGKTVYPGLIDLYVPRAWPEEKTKGKDAEPPPQGGDSNAQVHPERDMLEHARDATADAALRAAGITTALVAPTGAIFSGKSVLLDLGEGDLGASVLRSDFAEQVAIRPPKTDREDEPYPGSVMGAVALFRQRILDARWLRQAEAAYRANAAQERPDATTALLALEAAAHGEQLFVFESRDALETLRDLDLVDEFSLEAWIVASGEEWKRLDRLAKHPVPLVLPVGFPEPPKVGESDDLTVGLEELRTWAEAPKAPARLLAAKIPVAFSSFGTKEPADLHAKLAAAIENGLTPDQALAAFTTTPAELAGLAGRAGTIEPGKLANLVVADGDLFSRDTKIRAVWIDGDRYEIEDKAEAKEKEKRQEKNGHEAHEGGAR